MYLNDVLKELVGKKIVSARHDEVKKTVTVEIENGVSLTVPNTGIVVNAVSKDASRFVNPFDRLQDPPQKPSTGRVPDRGC